MEINWEEFTDMLNEHVLLVTFRKAKGEIRVMEATRLSYLLPEVTNPREPNDEVVVVFDLEKEAWRSFRKDSVMSYEVMSK